jgi:hypothetical protein
MLKKTSLFLFILTINIHVFAEVDGYKEIEKLLNKDDVLESECDASLHMVAGAQLAFGFEEKYKRELSNMKVYAACGNEILSKKFTPSDNELGEFIIDYYVNIQENLGNDFETCPSGVSDRRIKKLFFEPNVFKTNFLRFLSSLRSQVSVATYGEFDLIQAGLISKDTKKICRNLSSDPERTMPPSWSK